MATLGNVLWHVPFLGFLNAIIVYALGLLLTLTLVAAPLGRGLMEYGKFLLAPYSRTMISTKDLGIKHSLVWKVLSVLVMIVYLPFGAVLWLATIVQIVLLFMTVVGIPVAGVLARSLGTYFNPVNKKCVPRAVAEELERRSAQEYIARHRNS